MAGDLLLGGVVGAGLGEAVSKLSDVIIHVIKKTWYFKGILKEVQNTITRLKPTFDEIEKLNEQLDARRQETERFIRQLKDAEDLVNQCTHIKWRYDKKYTHALKLEALKASLLSFCQIDLQLQNTRDIKKLLVAVRDTDTGCSGGWSSGAPSLKDDLVGFGNQLEALKAMVLKDPADGGSSVVVVSAAGGCGKTTLVTMLCHDPDIKGKFGRNIYFVTISETPKLQIAIKNLLQKNQADQKLEFINDEDAISQWGSFLRENKSEILLVLDDVWSDSIVRHFQFKSPGYKILVTSRSKFPQYDAYSLQLLNDQEATTLFCRSAFAGDGSVRIDDILNDLVDKLVKCCKNHPLTLSVIGGLLKGRYITEWHDMLNNLSEGKENVLDLNDKSILKCLERSLKVLEKESEIKQCYMDLGLFPEDQKIAASTLMDMWVTLYEHDKEGSATLKKLFQLSEKNLATLLPIRKNSPVIIATRCEEKAIMQHDLMRTLAISLSSQGPVEHRKRLIINLNGQHLHQLPHTVNARILSISTDGKSFPEWNNISFPDLEVFVLNFMSAIHPLPEFMQNMESLKVLIITNYGDHFAELQKFPAPQYLSSLTSIRLDHVSISLISSSILELANLQKLSITMCKIGNSFNECTLETRKKLPNLSEIDIDSCDDLFTFPEILCNLVCLKKLSITNCLELTSLSDGFGNLTNLDVLRLASCLKLPELPESISNLQKLSVIDLSHCLNLSKFPAHIGELASLRTIYMPGCTGLQELPPSIKELCSLKVFCDQEISQKLWADHPDVDVQVVEEDRLHTLSKIINGW